MHVAILVKEFPPDVIGGTETQSYRMAQELEERGHEVTVYTKDYEGPETLDTSFELVRVPNYRASTFLSTLTFILSSTIYLIRDSRKFDVLQCMMIYPNGFVGYVVSALTKLPYFAWIRGGDFYFMKENRVKRWMISKVLSDTLVLVQTERIYRDVFDEFPHGRFELGILGNGVYRTTETADGDDVVYMGRLKNQKGVDVLIRALEGTEKRLSVVGDGPERRRLERLAEEVDVEARFVGEVDPDDVGEFLADGEVFVLPSVRGEGLPNTVLEAMAAGLPVVVTDTGGAADVVVERETGFVVPAGDVEALKDRLSTICSDRELRERMGANARRYVAREYSWDTLLTDLESIYCRVVGTRQGRDER